MGFPRRTASTLWQLCVLTGMIAHGIDSSPIETTRSWKETEEMGHDGIQSNIPADSSHQKKEPRVLGAERRAMTQKQHFAQFYKKSNMMGSSSRKSAKSVTSPVAQVITPTVTASKTTKTANKNVAESFFTFSSVQDKKSYKSMSTNKLQQNFDFSAGKGKGTKTGTAKAAKTSTKSAKTSISEAPSRPVVQSEAPSLSPAAPPPSNDSCDTATFFGTLGIGGNAESSGSTLSASIDVSGLGCGIEGEATVWYTFIAGDNFDLEASLCGSSYDTILAIFEGDSCDELLCRESNDDDCDAQSRVTLSVEASKQYYVAVSGFAGARGSYMLILNEASTPAPFPPVSSSSPTTSPISASSPTTSPISASSPTTSPISASAVPTMSSNEPTISSNPTVSFAPSVGDSQNPTISTPPTTSTPPSASPTLSALPTDSMKPSLAPSQGPTMSSKPTTSDPPTGNPTLSDRPTESIMPSRAPSEGPTVSAAPTTSTPPSGSPTLSALPTKSIMPSRAPSEGPTVSAAPTTSTPPSGSPTLSALPTKSIMPSRAPSEGPTASTPPTMSRPPSASPTLSDPPTTSQAPTLSDPPTVP